MKNKMLIVVFFFIVSFSSILYESPNKVYAMINSSEYIMPIADGLVWKYKTENRILYKRLYNVSQKKWVGNWIRC